MEKKTKDEKIQDAIYKNPTYSAILLQYYRFLASSFTKQGTPYRKSSILKSILHARQLLRNSQIEDASDLKVEMVVKEVLKVTLSREDKLVAFKKFCSFLDSIGVLDSSENTKIQDLKIKGIKKPAHLIKPKDKKKWSIPKNRWDEVYQQLNTNSKIMAAWMGLNLCMREGEIAHAKTTDITFSHDPTLPGQLFIQEDESREWDPKTPSGYRIITLTPDQQMMFKNFLQQRKEFLEREFPEYNHDYIIYSTYHGQGVTEQTIYDWMSKVKLDFSFNGEAYQKQLRPHVLRYSGATNLYFTTRMIYEISKILGHASIKQTEDYLALGEKELFHNMYQVMLQAGL